MFDNRIETEVMTVKLLLGTVEALFTILPQGKKVAYWNTVARTTYESGLPLTGYKIRVTALVDILGHRTLAEVTIACGTHTGEPYDEMDKVQREKVMAYKQGRQAEIVQLAHCHGVELRPGILTLDPAEALHGGVKESTEVQS